MSAEHMFVVRVTGVLIEDGKILLVQQKLSEKRNWSLPGGKLECGETLEQGLVREMKEETGLDVEIDRLMYVCDANASGNRLLHITFLLKRTNGSLQLHTNEFDENPINDVRFVPLSEPEDYGFSEKFRRLAENGFPGSGNYMGDKTNIGLGI
ncbi:MAG: NUDIX hydrolase [Eubacteriales bacterium]|nr:NUDIX hydrolase [Eubacteriales bacterium]